jgi:enterobactin synthetase component D
MIPASASLEFVAKTDCLTLAGFKGVCLFTHFNPLHYSDELFAVYGVQFPSALNSANSKRKAAFLAGRISANLAFLKLGLTPQTVGIGTHRKPLWPKSAIGSISHHSNTGYCMLMHRPVNLSLQTAVGIDVESVLPANECRLLAPSVISIPETQLLLENYHGLDRALTLAFSAKEAVFKAIYPAVGQYFDFLDVRISTVSIEAATLGITLVKDLSPEFLKGHVFKAHYQLDDIKVISWVLP